MSVLICYPHGLGDCILLTPAIREYFWTTGNKVSIATLKRFESARFFDNNPYVDKIFYTKDAWNDYPTYEEGCEDIYRLGKEIAKENNIKSVAFPLHKLPKIKEKVISNFVEIGLKNCINPTTELHTTTEEVEKAKAIISEKVGDNKFGFVQTKSGRPAQNLPEGYGRKWLSKNKGLDHVIEVGVEIDGMSLTIGTQFEILRRAAAVCLPDSVFYHACCAMHKPVDFVWFEKGEWAFKRSRPAHLVAQNVKYTLDEV